MLVWIGGRLGEAVRSLDVALLIDACHQLGADRCNVDGNLYIGLYAEAEDTGL